MFNKMILKWIHTIEDKSHKMLDWITVSISIEKDKEDLKERIITLVNSNRSDKWNHQTITFDSFLIQK